MNLDDLISDIKSQKKLSISKAITLVENNLNESHELLSRIYKHSGNAH